MSSTMDCILVCVYEMCGKTAQVERMGFRTCVYSLTFTHPKLRSLPSSLQNVNLIMELCDGGELFNSIIKRKRYPERDAARVVRAILSVIHFMNTKGLMHRDIKPENVVLTHEDSYTNIRIVDFGQAVRFRPGGTHHQGCLHCWLAEVG